MEILLDAALTDEIVEMSQTEQNKHINRKYQKKYTAFPTVDFSFR